MSQKNDPGSAPQKIADFLQILVRKGGLDIDSEVLTGDGQGQQDAGSPAGGAVALPNIWVNLSGPDTALLLAYNGELLNAIEHIAAKILRLEPEEHDRICFDANGFKAKRDRELRATAEAAIQKVRATGRPFAFPPMSSRERRMLHLILAGSGLPTASSGDGPRRFVVLYPEGQEPAPQPTHTPDREQAIRKRFRPR